MVENVTRFKRFTTKTFTFSFFKKTPEEQFRANTESYRSASVLEQKDDDGVFLCGPVYAGGSRRKCSHAHLSLTQFLRIKFSLSR